jgi:protein subunit release factor A
MIDRLRQIESSYDAVVAEMATEAAASDPARLQALGRELARLEPVMAAIRAWSAIRDELGRPARWRMTRTRRCGPWLARS